MRSYLPTFRSVFWQNCRLSYHKLLILSNQISLICSFCSFHPLEFLINQYAVVSLYFSGDCLSERSVVTVVTLIFALRNPIQFICRKCSVTSSCSCPLFLSRVSRLFVIFSVSSHVCCTASIPNNSLDTGLAYAK